MSADAQGSGPEAGGACPPGTKGCICGTLSALYERGELALWAGRVDRSALARKLGATRWSRLSTQAGRRSKAPGRCVVRFDRLLKEQGHGRRWAERLPAIRAYLERCKESGTLPMTHRRTLNRSAVLREFAPDMKSHLSIPHANPAVKALLDEYDDVIRGDERYSPYKYDALEGELEELLDREFELAHKGKINKHALARRLGVPPAVLSWTPKLDALIREKQAEVDEVQRRGVAGGACMPGTKGCICGTLAVWYERGELDLWAGRVRRVALARKLGATRWSGCPTHAGRCSKAPGRCVVRFDHLLKEQGRGRLWDERLPAIRVYLERCKESGTLPMSRRGRLNRSAVLREFQPHRNSVGSILLENPAVKVLLDEYDVIEGDKRYSPYKYDALEGELEELLDRDPFELVHGRKINKTALTRRLGVRRAVLCSTPKLDALIQKKQWEVDESRRRGVTASAFRIHGADHINLGVSPYSKAHECVFDFSALIEEYGLAFVERVATTFVAVTGNLAFPTSQHRRVVDFLTWLAALPESMIAQRMRDGRLVDRREFLRVALLYQQEVVHGENRKEISSRFAIIEKLGEAGLFPRVHFPKTVDRRRRQVKNPRPSLAEAPVVDADARKILEAAEAASKYRDLALGAGKDAIAFAQTLAVERARRTDLPESLPETIRILCDERLVELRKAASTIFEEWRKTYQEGRELLGQAEHDGVHIFEMLEQEREHGIETMRWRRLLASLFPTSQPRRALANLLAVVETKFHGICPKGTSGVWGKFWGDRFRIAGGTEALQAYLCPPRLVVSAVVCLLLCESGVNSDVALRMKANAIRASQRPRHIIVTGRKARARNRAIYSELPLRRTVPGCTSAAEALLFYADAVRPLRTGHEDMPLFVHVSRTGFHALTHWRLHKDFSAIVATSERLSSLRIYPTMIRSTVLLAMQLRHPDSLEAVQMFAQHRRDTTTMGYVSKLPYRMILEQRMRRFAETIEVVVADRDAWEKMGRPVAGWREAIGGARRTGLGVWCRDPEAGAQPDVPKGTACHAVDRCLGCKKVLVVADEESVADMIVWSKALEDAEPTWLDDNPERWTEHWVPWRAFFEVVLKEKMTRGVLAAIKQRAADRAAARMALPQFQAPQPW